MGYYEDGTLVSANATLSFTVNANRTLEARFSGVTPTTYTVTANAGTGGTVSGGGSFAAGASCTLTASAASGYHFLGWYENGSSISTTNPLTITVNSNRTIEGRFEADAPASGHTLSLSPIDMNGNVINSFVSGTTGAGTYANGAEVQIDAPDSNYAWGWQGWYSDINHTTLVSTQRSYAYTMPDHDVTLYAVYASNTD